LRGQRVDYFGAGPAALPGPVLQQLAQDVNCYGNTGVSILELSHRSAAYEEIQDNAVRRLRNLLQLDDDFEVLFLGGGASLQFAMLPLNFASVEHPGAYVLTGHWSVKAYEEACRAATARVAASTQTDGFRKIPGPEELDIQPTDAYLHITSNNTIVGSQWRQFPDVPVPLVADMSSDILSRRFPARQFHMIYAGAQKNLGPAGVTVVLIRKSWVDSAETNAEIPVMLRYSTHIKASSRYNTPPVFAVHTLGLVLQWVEEQGGVEEMERRNSRKAALLYSAIDESGGFYQGVVEPESRSYMNVTFRLPNAELEKEFLAKAKEAGFHGLAGHRSVGGCRVSLYNAVSEAACERLTAFMEAFRHQH
jgi:phosphoserine aminotransferase